MKRLTRSTKPNCLNGLVGGRHHWENVNKDDIWLALARMQNGYCAYCECRLDRKHIEHFRNRDEFKALTFVWENIFGSCGDTRQKGGWQRCGIYKDNGAGDYLPEELIKPDDENPSFFLHFLISGKVRPREGLSAIDKHKALETIRVFNLNDDPVLYGSRRKAIQAELYLITGFYKMQDEFSPDEWDEFLNGELMRVADLEFSTALTHAWIYNEQY
ncbi:MAG: uncharacterized protein H6R25_2805 [Proteobacteria bacterium]|nr:uncharacterized protein [Pseudomonadota bacterium]